MSAAGCHYCGETEATRPYGPGGSRVCWPCAHETPDRTAQTTAAMTAQYDAAKAMSPVGGVVIGGANGYEPLVPEADA
jgi:hypothetical protein